MHERDWTIRADRCPCCGTIMTMSHAAHCPRGGYLKEKDMECVYENEPLRIGPQYPPLTPELAYRIAEEIRRCYHVQALAGGDPVKEMLPLTILRVPSGAAAAKQKGESDG